MVILAGQLVLRSDDYVIAQLRPIAPHIHKCDSAANAEENIVELGAVDEDERTHERGGVRLLLSLNLQALLAILLNHRISGGSKPALANDGHHVLVEFVRFDRLAHKWGQLFLHRFCHWCRRANNFDKLGHRRGPSPGISICKIRLPLSLAY